MFVISRKISKSGDTRCHKWRLKCIKSAFRWGSFRDTAGELKAPSYPPSLVKGSTSTGRKWKGKGKQEGKVKESKLEMRWREVLGLPKKFGVVPPMRRSEYKYTSNENGSQSNTLTSQPIADPTRPTLVATSCLRKKQAKLFLL